MTPLLLFDSMKYILSCQYQKSTIVTIAKEIVGEEIIERQRATLQLKVIDFFWTRNLVSSTGRSEKNNLSQTPISSV